MMIRMRTTIDIPSGLHERISAHAKMQGKSFSATATDALLRGMAPIETPTTAKISPVTGLLTFNFSRGRLVTADEVADLIDEDES